MEKKTKILILFIGFAILILIGGFFLYWQKTSQNIRENVLSLLEENLEFCKILKDNISFHKGEFWLICNGRPFYAEYKNGEVNYELNGWGWLKNTNYWDELKNCDFYKSEKNDYGYNLMFYCPYDFKSDNLIIKTYNFDLSSRKINKIKELSFIDIVTTDIKENYPFLDNCTIFDFASKGGRGYTPLLEFIFNCGEEKYKVTTNLLIIGPPVLTTGINFEEIAKLSFENSFGKTPQIIDSKAQASFNSGDLIVYYPTATQSFLIEIVPKDWSEDNIKNLLVEIGKYFIFPKTRGNLELILQKNNILIYTADNEVFEVVESNNKILGLQRMSEGIK